MGRGQNATLSFTVTPIKIATFTDTGAKVEYTENAVKKITFTANFGKINIISPEKYHSVYANYLSQWIIFFILTGFLTIGPFWVYSSYHFETKK